MKRLALTLLLVFATCSLSSPAQAFVTLKTWSGSDIYWNKNSIPWYIHPNGSDNVPFEQLKASILAGMAAWDDLGCFSKSITFGGTKTNDPEDGVYLRFQESNWDPSVGDALAYAQTWKSWTNASVITNGVIVFNGQDATWSVADTGFFSNAADVQGVLTHEMGHILGLDHTRYVEATMFFSGGGGPEMRTLEPDDENGLCYIYGSFSDGVTCDSCSANSDCVSGQCKTVGSAKFCRTSCSNDAQCGDTFVCELSTGLCKPSNGYCSQEGGNVSLGGYCYGMEICQSGLCLALPGDAYCSKECTQNSQCPGMKCTSGYCIFPGEQELGEPCMAHFDCVSGTCIGIGNNQGICSQTCSGPTQCPSGLSCVNNYCYPGGDTPYGQDCTDDLQCEYTKCVSIGTNKRICSAACTSSGQCPDGDPCVLGYCIPKGIYPLGMKCTLDTDCISGYCVVMGTKTFCTQSCSDVAPCPTGSTCTTSNYCTAVTGLTWCLTNADCPSGNFCKRPGSADYGQCVKSCNPFSDAGCGENQDCAWYWDNAAAKIRGECVAYAGDGQKFEEACGIISPKCRPSLVCVSPDQATYTCHRDCDTSNGLGCVTGETCLSMGNNNDPLHGFCHCPGECDEPPPPPDVVDQDWGPWKPDNGASEETTEQLDQPDQATPSPDSATNLDQSAGPDLGVPTTQDSAGSEDTWTPGTTDPKAQDAKSSSCSVGGTPSAATFWMVLLLLAGLALRARRTV